MKFSVIIPVFEVLSSVQKMEAKSSLVLLNGDNYGTWKVQVKMCLIKEDLWRLVNGTETAPTDANALATYNIRKDKAPGAYLDFQFGGGSSPEFF